VASVTIIVGDDVAKCLEFVKPALALYIGGMGARGKNFYNDLDEARHGGRSHHRNKMEPTHDAQDR
jgi:hypothetical protein